MRMLRVIFSLLVAVALAACSRSQKTGKSISAQDIAKAMPEFLLVMPAGSTNLYLEQDPHSIITTVHLKLSVPRTSLTNFLTLSGLNEGFIAIPAGTIPPASIPFPAGLDVGSAFNWAADVRHAAEWDLRNGKIPLRMSCIKTSAKSSPLREVFLMVWVDDTTSSQAKVYLEYYQVPKRR